MTTTNAADEAAFFTPQRPGDDVTVLMTVVAAGRPIDEQRYSPHPASRCSARPAVAVADGALVDGNVANH